MALAILASVVAACGNPTLTVDEFCELSRQADIETVRLVQIPQGTAEFDAQQAKLRDITDRMFSNAPEDLAPVAEELLPMLTATDADNERVNLLLERITVYVEQNCGDVAE